MSEDQVNEMLESYEVLTEIRKREFSQTEELLDLNKAMLEVQEHRNDILVEILSVLKGEK